MYRQLDFLPLAGLAVVYILLAKIVLTHFSPNGVVSIIWPSSGLALAALLLGGGKYWPGVFIGALAANISAGSSLPVSGCIATGNTLEALIGLRLLARSGRFDSSLGDPRDYLRLCLAGAAGACISALIGNSALRLAGFLNWQSFAENLPRWWQGDALGIFLVTPFILVWRRAPRGWFERTRAAETLACLGLAWLFGQAIFLDWYHRDLGAIAFGYWMFLFVAWGAVRLGRHGVLLIAGMTAVQALWGSAHGIGFFGRDIGQTGLLNLWFYLVVLTALGMTLTLTIHAREKAEAEVRRSEAHFRFVTESAQAMIWMSGTDKLCTWFNKMWLDFTGRTPEQEMGNGWAEGVHPDDLRPCIDLYVSRFDRREPFSMEYRLRRRDGEYRWILDNGVPRFDARGNFEGYIGSCFDITERMRNEQELQLAATVYQAIGEAIMVADAGNRVVSVNAAFTELTGYTAEEALGQPTSLLKSGRHDRHFYQEMWHSLDFTGRWQGEIVNRRKDGEEYLEWLMISTVYDDNGAVLRRVGMFSDITDRKQTEQIIWRQANFDPLTGLPNRTMFHDRLKQEIKKADRTGRTLGLLFIDLDRFKEINDTLGHDMGDFLLKQAAKRLNDCVRATDTVARLGGDEFTVILSELDEPDSSERIARNILGNLAEPFSLGEEVAYVSASIGITLYPDDADSSESLLKNADQAMYAAKNQGRNGYHYFTASMQEAAQARMRLGVDLRGALSGGQFLLYYQPIVELVTGAIRKAEALIRWRHPMRGLIGPGEFIPIAEETGMISDIGDWVFHEAARQALLWRSAYYPEFQISVNKSPVQFRKNGSRHAEWLGYLREIGSSGQALAVEITESLLLDSHASVIETLLEFRGAGLQISLDDFGTGYSSLSYLKKFPIDYLKIDQSFVRHLTPDSGDMAMCEAIIVMAHKLGIKVVAEGVETREHRELLAAAGCDYGQGFFFAKPMPAEEFVRMLVKMTNCAE
jgi:diguanylate cyclase (GGDEF)-like protein/PAS domain S-box-containing protein